MKESVKIIQQVINKLLSIETSSDTETYHSIFNIAGNKGSLINSSRNRFKSAMEELIFSFYENSLGSKVESGSISCFIEAPKGETGVHLFSDGSSRPYRCKIKAPGFLHLQGLDLISRNSLVADVVTNIGSLDIVFGEIDR